MGDGASLEQVQGQVEYLADDLSEFEAGDAVARSDVKDAVGVQAKEVEYRRRSVRGVGRRYTLVRKEWDGLATTELGNNPSDAVRLVLEAVPPIEGAEADDQGTRKAVQDAKLARSFRHAVDAQRPRCVLLIVGSCLAVEDVIGRNVHEASVHCLAELRNGRRPFSIYPFGLVGMVLTVVDTGKGRAEDDVVGLGGPEGFLQGRGIGEVCPYVMDSWHRARGPTVGRPYLVVAGQCFANDVLAKEAAPADDENSSHGPWDEFGR